MPSLLARHARSCAYNATAEIPDDCTCKPTWYVDLGKVDGRHIQERIGKNRTVAGRALRKIQVAVDEETYEAPKTIAFHTWADEWLRVLRRPKENTRRSYKATLDYAKAAFGSRPVRKIGPADIDRFLGLMDKVSPSTQRKHLRVLNACLGLAVKRGYASKNPVALLEGSELPQKVDRERPFFENEELPRLWAEVPEGIYMAAIKTALGTGLRQAELVGLHWREVDLGENVIRVRTIYTSGIGFTEPKTKHSKRDVFLSNAIVDMLGAWWGECGQPDDEALVFPGFGRDGQLVDSTLRRALYDAMERAGIRRLHAKTGEERDFHSLRHTHAKLALESGRSMLWLSRQLGHSDVNVTARVYAHIEDAVRAEQARELVIPGV